MSIAIMAGVLEARGHNVTVIDPVEKLLAVGHYLESTVDIAESTRRIAASRIPADHMVLMAGFTAGNEKGELVVLGRNRFRLLRGGAGCLFTRRLLRDLDGR